MKLWLQNDRTFSALLFLIVPAIFLLGCDLIVGLGFQPLAFTRMTFETVIIGCFLASLKLRRSNPNQARSKTTKNPRL